MGILNTLARPRLPMEEANLFFTGFQTAAADS